MGDGDQVQTQQVEPVLSSVSNSFSARDSIGGASSNGVDEVLAPASASVASRASRSSSGRLSSSSVGGLSSSGRLRRMGPRYTKARELCIHWTGEYPDVGTIGAQEVQRLRNNGASVLLIDVRLPEEQEVSIIQGAVTQDEFERPDKREVYGPQALLNSLVVPYCTIGYRSGAYARKLKALGYASVRNGEGVVMWTHDVGCGLVDPSGVEVKRVHVYGSAWDIASAEYSAVYFGPWNWVKSHAAGAWRWVASFWTHWTYVTPAQREETTCKLGGTT